MTGNKTSVCNLCGERYEKTNQRQKYCPECAYILRYTHRPKPKAEKPKPKPKPKKIVPIAEINRLARKQGMSYGQYVDHLEQKKREKEERRRQRRLSTAKTKGDAHK